MPTHQSGWLAALFFGFLHLGFFGLLLLGVLDSSFLVLPFANDVAVIILSSLHHARLLLYTVAATAGSVAGCYIMYWVGRKGGEAFIEAHVSGKRFARMRDKVAKQGPFLLAIPAIMPPPFPFTAWVLAAGALNVPRERFMAALAAMRFLRFFLEGVLALLVGKRIIQWLNTPAFKHFIEFLVVVAIVGSAYSIYQLIRATRRRGRNGQQQPAPAQAA